MTVTGESFDYGPWRFAPVADPAFTAAYFDQTAFGWLEATRAPFERFFFDWFCGRASAARRSASPLADLYAAPDFAETKALLLAAAPSRPERLDHPYFSLGAPCTMLIDEVEAIWARIAEGDDWSALDAKIEAIAAMREAYGFAPAAV